MSSRPVLGLISDTHDVLRPEAVAALRGAELLVHAGDVCRPEVLQGLEAVAPVRAVRGNNDRGAWAEDLPLRDTFDWRGTRIHVVHDRADAAPDGADLVVFGHSHRPSVESLDGRLWVNPGSAGPRRFTLPVSVAVVRPEGGRIDVEVVELDVPPPRRDRA